jgi:hypothetical protein
LRQIIALVQIYWLGKQPLALSFKRILFSRHTLSQGGMTFELSANQQRTDDVPNVLSGKKANQPQNENP